MAWRLLASKAKASVGKQQLAFIYTSRSRFVKRDIDILDERYEVIEFHFHSDRKLLTPLVLLKQLLFLFKISSTCKLVVVQFGGYHAFLPTLLSKGLGFRCAIIAGGVDCVYYPEIGYGYMGKSFISHFTKYAFKHCNLILPKHESLIQFIDYYNAPNGIAQGLKSFMKTLSTPYQVIYNGFDKQSFAKSDQPKERGTYVTMALGLEKEVNVKLKGIDLILQIAAKFPDSTFTIIGGTRINNRDSVPQNVLLLPPQNHQELIGTLSKSEFYLQLSMSEGFPNALCEAMLCECIPIGSNVNAIPEIIGETGFVLRSRNVDELESILNKTSNQYSEAAGKACRDRIVRNFGIEKRRDQLLDAIGSLSTEMKKPAA